jgi:hypothetical protein
MDTTRDLMRAGLKVAIWHHLDYFAHANYGHRKAATCTCGHIQSVTHMPDIEPLPRIPAA